MKSKFLVPIALAAIVLAVTASPALTQVTLAKPGNGHGNIITWSPNPVTGSVAPGAFVVVPATFTSSVNLTNVTLDITPSLGGTVTIVPNTFAAVLAGVPNPVTITFTAPATGDRTQFNGVVHLRTGHQNHPQNLKLRFTVTPGP